jgi:hypothetical protein
MNCDRLPRNLFIAVLVLGVAASSSWAGTSGSVRYLAAGMRDGKIYVLGQEVRVRWKGMRKRVHWDEENIKVERGRSLLLLEGVEIVLQGVDPLEGQTIGAVAFNADEGAFVIVRPRQANGPNVIVKLYVDGRSVVYDLPTTSRPSKYWEQGFYFDSDCYLHKDGLLLRNHAVRTRSVGMVGKRKETTQRSCQLRSVPRVDVDRIHRQESRRGSDVKRPVMRS